MKRINNYVLNGAIALLSTAGLVACSSSDDVTDAPVNPTYDGKSVKTQFAINVATPSKSQTRMSDVNTQNGGNFLGMKNIYLIPFVDEPKASLYETTNRTNYTFPSSVISLTDLSDIDNTTDKKNYHIYNDVNVPIGTKNFLFYGTSPISESTYKEKGALKVTDFTTLTQNSTSSISYSLVDIAATSGINNALTSTQTAFATYLSSIADADGWSTISENENATLFNAYKNFTGALTNGGLRAGSAAAIKEMIQSLTTIVNPLKTKSESATSVSSIADKIIEKIKASYFDIDANGNVSWKTSVEAETRTFPTNLGLPEGCMILTCTDGDFSYASQPTMPSSGSSTINLYDITYPAAIAYRANTELAAKSEEVSSWPTQYGNWESSDWNGWGNEVLATTRSIALKKNIQYGVAQMVTQIKTASSILNDNSTDNKVSVNANSFSVTGILVGGQRQSIDWEFLPEEGSSQRVIYDADIPSGTYAASTGWSNPIYTLVFDNYVDGDKNAQETVRIAVELQNNSNADFTGVDGIVAQGQKFYLIAELNPKASSGLTAISWPESNTNRFPQFKINRTFVQDYKTCVNLTINTLKNAYVTIPDLRSVKLQLGLSVDLQWQTGLTFDVPLGGTIN